MRSCAIGLAVGLTLVLSTLSDPGAAEARQEIVNKVAPRGAVGGKVANLPTLMKLYKPQEKGGLGFGDKPDPKSGIEKKIIDLQRKAPLKATLEKESKDLTRLANRTLAMADLTKPHFPGPMNGKKKKDWDGWLDEQKKAARELKVAIEKEDGNAVARAAKNLMTACSDCHASFRN